MIHIQNWINGKKRKPNNSSYIDKFNPHTGNVLYKIADSGKDDVDIAIESALDAFPSWSELTPVKRGQILSSLVDLMKQNADELTECIAVETGKPPADAKGEVGGAILQGEFFAGEGMRLYGRSLTSGMQGKQSFTVRQPHGVAGLIVPSNAPIANIAWKVFPALICGNTVVMKAAEDSPRIAELFADITKESGLPDGVFNVIQGNGNPAGAAIVEDSRVPLISFTGSSIVGKYINEVAGRRLARVSLELGGKNPFVVCDDANLEKAVHWASLSAFSNAGQRCTSGSRILIFEDVYEEFREKFIQKASSLTLGVTEGCDLGPVIKKEQQKKILTAIEQAKKEGANILCGGKAPDDSNLKDGYYIKPTVIEGLEPKADLNCMELFGPVATIYPVRNLQHALELANDSEYGLTAAIQTTDINKAMWFAQRVRTGVANINLGTFGSEPHMPFGGFGSSGNGTREPGVEALDVYSELKNISIFAEHSL